MSARFVRRYSRTVFNYATGRSATEECEFTEAQAASIGAVLHSNGLNNANAQKLVEQWTQRGKHTDIVYSYALIVE